MCVLNFMLLSTKKLIASEHSRPCNPSGLLLRGSDFSVTWAVEPEHVHLQPAMRVPEIVESFAALSFSDGMR